MADLKISALPASSTPLAGTEVLPIVQSSTTKQVSVANLTAGRAISATQITLTTGNVIVANGQGIDFSATPGTGTSELLADYEEGTWTPTLTTTGTGFTSVTYNALVAGYYVKVGKVVHVQGIMFTDAVTKGSASGEILIGGLPFTAAANSSGKSDGFSSVTLGYTALFAVNQPIGGYVSASSTQITLTYKLTSNGASVSMAPTDIATSSGNLVRFSGTYVSV